MILKDTCCEGVVINITLKCTCDDEAGIPGRGLTIGREIKMSQKRIPMMPYDADEAEMNETKGT